MWPKSCQHPSSTADLPRPGTTPAAQARAYQAEFAQAAHAPSLRSAPAQKLIQKKADWLAGLACFKIGARAKHRVGIDHRARVAPGHMLTELRLVHGLVRDAGIGRRDPHAVIQRQNLALLADLLRILPQPRLGVEVHALCVAESGHDTLRFLQRHIPQKTQAAVAHDFNVAHHGPHRGFIRQPVQQGFSGHFAKKPCACSYSTHPPLSAVDDIELF